MPDAHVSVHAVNRRIDGNNKDTGVLRPDSTEILSSVIGILLTRVVGVL